MKRFISLILSLTFVLVLAGCNNRSMNYIIENEPSVVGVVEEVQKRQRVILTVQGGQFH